jgi:WD40 repeat protein
VFLDDLNLALVQGKYINIMNLRTGQEVRKMKSIRGVSLLISLTSHKLLAVSKKG